MALFLAAREPLDLLEHLARSSLEHHFAGSRRLQDDARNDLDTSPFRARRIERADRQPCGAMVTDEIEHGQHFRAREETEPAPQLLKEERR